MQKEWIFFCMPCQLGICNECELSNHSVHGECETIWIDTIFKEFQWIVEETNDMMKEIW